MSVRIMVVDDEQAIGQLLIYQLRGLGYQASYVANPIAALRHFLLEQPDLVLLDVMMPQLSGWDLCAQIRACSDVPIILLTGKDSDYDVITGLKAGADDYITKPYSLSQLEARIETVMRRSKPQVSSSNAILHATNTSNVSLAYAHVRQRQHQQEQPKPIQLAQALPKSSQAPSNGMRIGQRLREAREQRNITLHQAERICKIRWEFLQALEQENYEYLPRGQRRAVLSAYCQFLKLDLRELLGTKPKANRQSVGILHSFDLWTLSYFAFVLTLIMALAVGIYLL